MKTLGGIIENVLAFVRYAMNEPRLMVQRWIERGDLITPIILVSAKHYIDVLNGKDFWLIAATVGILVDIGHYRLVKSSTSVNIKTWRSASLWLLTLLGAVVMTFFAFCFHLFFYEENIYELLLQGVIPFKALVQAGVIPTVIIFLGILSVRERWSDKIDDDKTAKAKAGADNQASKSDNDADNDADGRKNGGEMTRQQRLDAIRKINLSRNGQGMLPVADIVAMFNVKERTAQRDYQFLKREKEREKQSASVA